VRTGLRAGWIRRRWWVLLVAVIVATPVGGLVASIRPGSYSASMVFVVRSSGATGIAPDAAQRLASTYAALMPEDDLITQAIGHAVKRRSTDVKGRLTAVNPVNTALIRVTYQGATAAEAAAGMAALQKALTGPQPASPAVRANSLLPVQAATIVAPSSRLMAIVLAAMLGLCSGAVIVITLERSDVRIDDRETLAELAPEVPVLDTVAPIGRRGGFPVRDRPFTPAAEGFQSVRIALERLGVGNDVGVLCVMSADKQEGRSTFAANLAIAMARQDRFVLLISGDMRRPGLEKLFGLKPTPGWAELLGGEESDPIMRLVSVGASVWLLPAGSPSANPAELLEARRMGDILKRMRYEDSFVVIDTPPARQSADALAMAGVADGVVLIVRSGRSRLRSVWETLAGLERANVRLLGMVLVDHRDRRRHNYGYRGNGANAGQDPRILPLDTHARRSNPKGDGGTRSARNA
jgi:polysaccharide biosynthesis transport protein